MTLRCIARAPCDASARRVFAERPPSSTSARRDCSSVALAPTPRGTPKRGEDPLVQGLTTQPAGRSVEAALETEVGALVGTGLDVATVDPNGWRAEEMRSLCVLIRLHAPELDLCRNAGALQELRQSGGNRLVVRAAVEIEQLDHGPVDPSSRWQAARVRRRVAASASAAQATAATPAAIPSQAPSATPPTTPASNGSAPQHATASATTPRPASPSRTAPPPSLPVLGLISTARRSSRKRRRARRCRATARG